MLASEAVNNVDIAGELLLAEHSRKELLRFITCGSVDDGKSTLIGRLLLETGSVYDDQIAALQSESRRHGTHGEEMDCALLLDGLEDERQQGITIDVAYRYFTTSKRKFIIADTPGHEQFTRNMSTGASTANLALILVDASKGLLSQTKRHSFIVSLLGIKHVVLAVNKMDLVNYDQSVFTRICADFREFARKLEIPDIRFVPLSALRGDNVAIPSSNMLWYENGSLLQILETVYIGADANCRELRFPVQLVNRPNSDFRGFSGTIASGTLRVNDEVVVLPSNKKTFVKRIVTRDGDLLEASTPQSVTVTLADEIDVSRGDMFARPGNRPRVSRQVDAMIVWMSEQAMVPHKQYWLKHTTRRTSGEISAVRYVIDVNTLHRTPGVALKLNEIGRCEVLLRDPVIFDPYRRNRETGSFILVDRITHETVAAGMFLDTDPDAGGEEHWDEQPASARLERAISLVSDKDRESRYQQRPFTVLITGLSGSGKTSVALGLEKYLFDTGKKCVLLDGQNMRFGISRDLGFSADERSENLRRAAEIAKLLNDSGIICIAAFVAPQDDIRQRVKQRISPQRFIHIHLTASLEVCKQRDKTGRYLAAERGEIADFPGVTSAYDEPHDPTLTISTDKVSQDEVIRQVIAKLQDCLDSSC